MIIIVRSNDVNPDPRVEKYTSFLNKQSIPYKVLAWNRGKEEVKKVNTDYFNLNAAYGKKHLNIKNKILWFIFVFKYLVKNKNKYNCIHACDLDTAIPVYISNIFCRKKIIYDIFDLSGNINSKSILAKLMAKFEKRVIEKADYVIVCENDRIKQIDEQIGKIDREYLIMPNIPNEINNTEIAFEKDNNYELVLGYTGIFDKHRGLEDLLEVVANHKYIKLNIGGFGLLGDMVESYADSNENIVYFGKVNYGLGLQIMKNSDLIVAMYYKTNKVHKYAAPNKYYEGLMLETPIITTKSTLVGNKTEHNKTGFAIEEGKKSIEKLLENLKQEEIKERSINCKNVWNKTYKNYINDFMEKIYSEIIK